VHKPNNWQKILALFGGDMDKVVTTKEILCHIGDGKRLSWYITPDEVCSYVDYDGRRVNCGRRRGLGYGQR
jgi:hypothetical protein